MLQQGHIQLPYYFVSLKVSTIEANNVLMGSVFWRTRIKKMLLSYCRQSDSSYIYDWHPEVGFPWNYYVFRLLEILQLYWVIFTALVRGVVRGSMYVTLLHVTLYVFFDSLSFRMSTISCIKPLTIASRLRIRRLTRTPIQSKGFWVIAKYIFWIHDVLNIISTLYCFFYVAEKVEDEWKLFSFFFLVAVKLYRNPDTVWIFLKYTYWTWNLTLFAKSLLNKDHKRT